MYQAGDKVRIISENDYKGMPLPGGKVGDRVIGSVVTLLRFVEENPHLDDEIEKKYGIDVVRGYWKVVEQPWVNDYVFNELAFEMVEPKEKPLNKLLYGQLYNMAQAAKIPGRSKMKKEALIASLRPPVVNPVPHPPPPKPVLSLYKELLEEAYNPMSTASYALRSEMRRHIHANDVCHARFILNAPVKEIVLNITKHLKVSKDPEAYKAFCSWMFNDSPMAKCFITKQFDDAIANGVQMDVSQPHGWNAMSAIALRMGSEFPKRLDTWDRLVGNGISSTTAWIMACFFKGEKDVFAFYENTANHCVHVHTFPLEGYMKFLREGFYFKEGIGLDPSSKTGAAFVVSKSICGFEPYATKPKDKISIGEYLKELAKVEGKRGQWGDIIYPPISFDNLLDIAKKFDAALKG